MKKFIYFLIFLASIYNTANSHDLKKCQFSDCALSPVVKVEHIPDNPIPYNDLTKGDGGLEDQYVDKILLRGVVLDRKCVPIPDAKIMLWQKDEYGDYRYNIELSTNDEQYKLDNKIYRNFKGNGTAASDNNGEFTFITVIPALEHHDLALVNVSVQAKGFSKFTTQLSLVEESQGKKKMKAVEAFYNEEASNFYGQEVYDFFLVLDGLNRYRQY